MILLLGRKPFCADNSLGRKQEIKDSLGGSQIFRVVLARCKNCRTSFHPVSITHVYANSQIITSDRAISSVHFEFYNGYILYDIDDSLDGLSFMTDTDCMFFSFPIESSFGYV